MKEYIEREALNKVIDYEIEVCNSGIAKGVLEMLKVRVEPAADVVEVRHGRWVSLTPSLLLEEFREMEADKFFMCSECKGECQLVEQDDYYDYCPHCGCKMDKEE